jgi:hypothetical protein
LSFLTGSTETEEPCNFTTASARWSMGIVEPRATQGGMRCQQQVTGQVA